MKPISRRKMLAATTVGGLVAATSARAENEQRIPQPMRPGRGGTDPGPRNLMRDRQNPEAGSFVARSRLDTMERPARFAVSRCVQ